MWESSCWRDKRALYQIGVWNRLFLRLACFVRCVVELLAMLPLSVLRVYQPNPHVRLIRRRNVGRVFHARAVNLSVVV